jgi:hypothetical protein
MIEQIVSLLTEILAELKTFRTGYIDAVREANQGLLSSIDESKSPEPQVAVAENPKKKKEKPAPTADTFPVAAPTAAAPVIATPPNPAPATGVPVTRDACGQALVELATSKNRDACVTVLGQFSAKLVKEVPEAQLPAFYAAIQEALK